MEFQKLIRERASVRSFKPSPLTQKQLGAIRDAANLAPSAGNMQGYYFYLVTGKETKEKLAKAAFNQGFIAEAPAVFVFFADAAASSKKYGERGNLFCIIDASLAAGYAQLAAADLGLGAVWVGAFKDGEVKETFGGEGRPVCILPVGIPAEIPRGNPRKDRLKKAI
ncbi:MAG: nitroreductase family protein [Candidatus ainarchaeum sp.]|nr:nitroreductase family protein [Candidatus ainarchaeum sp.]MDD5096186.1 nitroreductase family protein [Candidatus ainarchaeum sp.]